MMMKTIMELLVLALFLNYEMSYEIGSVYIDEALLDEAGLHDFPELYKNINIFIIINR
jgi:aspartate 1-decarboxylase